MTEKILVTGGCGFIGSNLVKRLLDEGYHVRIIDDLSSGAKKNIQSYLKQDSCEFIKGSITEPKFITKQLEGIDIIFHEAAKPDVRASIDHLFRDFDTNVKGTLYLLQGMVEKEVSKIVFASSGGTVYGETDVIPTPEDHPLQPISHYGASKAACEQYLSSFASLYDLEAISLRLGNIFGPPSNKGVMYDFFWKLKANPEELKILGNGKQVKSYLYVSDCVDAHIKTLSKTFDRHEPFNISTPEGISVNEIADEIVAVMGLADVEYSYTGGERGWAGDVKRAVADISKAERLLNWKPEVTIREGIRRYLSWLEKQEKPH